MRKISGRHIKVLTLLWAIVVGGLLAPTSHLVYMYLSDVHSTEMQHVDLGDTSVHDRTASHGSAGLRLSTLTEAHYECPYLALFATSLIAEAVDDDTGLSESDPVEVQHTITEAPRRSVSVTSSGARGPPQA